MKIKDYLRLGGGLCLVIYVFYVGIKSYFRYNEVKLDYVSKKHEILRENRKHDHLKQQVVLLELPDTWEYLAKSRLGFVKPGERVYKIVKKGN